MKTIGIDIGTTTISTVVIDANTGNLVESRTISNGSFLHDRESWERVQDAQLIVKKTKEVLDGFLDKYPDVTGIGTTGQMHGIVYVNQEGEAVSPLYTWQDGRGNLPEFDHQTMAELIRETCQISAATGFGLVTHAYHVKKQMVPEEAVSVATIPDYLGMVLTGRKKPLMHTTMAASLGFFDVKNMRFDLESLKKMGISDEILPDLTDGNEIYGTYRDLPVTVALGDNQASFFGTVGDREHVILLNMGTGGQISILSPVFFEAPGIEARPFLKDQYLLAGSSLCGGRAYAILEQFFAGYLKEATGECRSQYEVMARLAQKGKAVKPAIKAETSFLGTRENPSLRGSYTQIEEANFTPEAFVYATLDGMANELYRHYEVIREGTDIFVEHIMASGNGLRKNVVLQEIFQEKFQADLQLTEFEEEAAIGAARFAG